MSFTAATDVQHFCSRAHQTGVLETDHQRWSPSTVGDLSVRVSVSCRDSETGRPLTAFSTHAVVHPGPGGCVLLRTSSPPFPVALRLLFPQFERARYDHCEPFSLRSLNKQWTMLPSFSRLFLLTMAQTPPPHTHLSLCLLILHTNYVALTTGCQEAGVPEGRCPV